MKEGPSRAWARLLLWPALAALLVLAVAAPSVAFYLILKANWAEVSSIRQKLLHCQIHSLSRIRRTSPLPVMPKSFVLNEEPNTAIDVTGVDSVNKKGLPSSSARPMRSVSISLKEDAEEKDKEYVRKLERQIQDLRLRVSSCRKCLSPSMKKNHTCGGGPGWREHKKDKKIKKKQRKINRKKKMKKYNSTASTASENILESAQTQSDFVKSETWLTNTENRLDPYWARENHRVSVDFRRSFNQKISRMDEALMQFSETQAAFCKELRDNLGGRLEKRGQELGALSDQIAALVRTTTAQVTLLEKLVSDEVYSAQLSIEKKLAGTQKIRDAQIKNIQNFHKQMLLPAMVSLTTILSDQASSFTSLGVEIITKIEMLQDKYVTFATQQTDALRKLKEEVDMFASKHSNLIMRSEDHARNLHINTESFIRELQSRMNTVVKELVFIRLQSQKFVSLSTSAVNNISESLNKTKNSVKILSGDVSNILNSRSEKEEEFRNLFQSETDVINSKIETGISQVEDAELESRMFTNAAASSWNELYLNQEAELRLEADTLSNNLRSHTHHIQNILTGLQGTAESHEQVLEEQRMDFQRFIRKRQDALDGQCSAITDWSSLMSSELRRRDEDLHYFLSDELQLKKVLVTDHSDEYLVSHFPDDATNNHLSNSSYQVEDLGYSTTTTTSSSNSIPENPASSQPEFLNGINQTRILASGKSGEDGLLILELEEINAPLNNSLHAKTHLNSTTAKPVFSALIANASMLEDDEDSETQQRSNAFIVNKNSTKMAPGSQLKCCHEDSKKDVWANITDMMQDDEEDIGFQNLKKILISAKNTIEKFQSDFNDTGTGTESKKKKNVFRDLRKIDFSKKIPSDKTHSNGRIRHSRHRSWKRKRLFEW